MKGCFIFVLLLVGNCVAFSQNFNLNDSIYFNIKDMESKESLKNCLIIMLEYDSNKQFIKSHDIYSKKNRLLIPFKLNKYSRYKIKDVFSRFYFSFKSEPIGYFASKTYNIYLYGMFGKTIDGVFEFEKENHNRIDMREVYKSRIEAVGD